MVITRRRILQGSVGIAAFALRERLQGQFGATSTAGLRLQAVKEFRGASLRSISSDGGRVWASAGDAGIEVWTLRSGNWEKDALSRLRSNNSLWVGELASSRTVYMSKVDGRPLIGGFFRDSPKLYVTALIFKPGRSGNRQIVIDLQAGKIVEDQIRDGLFQPTHGPRLLALTGGPDPASRVLSIVELPDYREIARVELEAPAAGRSGTDQVISADGEVFVYGVDDLVVCRRTEDLGIVWTRRLGTPSSRVWRIAVSARGDRVAAVAAADTSKPGELRPLVLQPLYIGVLDGKTGESLARFPVGIGFDESLALSPNGEFLAAARRSIAADQYAELLIDLYDIASNRHIGQETHARVPPGRYQNRATAGPMDFTADGRYFVSSGYDRTTVWRIFED